MIETDFPDLQTFSGYFREIFDKNGLERYTEEPYLTQFYRFTRIFADANAKFNLSAIRDLPSIIAKHYADCLLAEPYIPSGASVIDVGCGGGFPSIPLAIVRRDIRILAIDSTGKKIDFVARAAKELGLENLKTRCARAESPEMSAMRGTFDLTVSRAVARLNILSELCIPFLKISGELIALKGAQGEEEAAEAANALRTLGADLSQDHRTMLITPDGEEQRHILVISKVCETPKQYPRQYSAILKKPL